MRMRLILSLMGLGLTAIVAGCASDGSGQRGGDMPLAEPVPILDHHAGDQAQGLDLQRRLLIQSADQLEQLGTDALSEVEVDWDTQDLVLVTMGMRSTGGYWCRITAAQVQGDTLYVQGVVNRPADEDMTTQGLTYPWAAAVIPSIDVQNVQWDLMPVEGASPGDH